MLVSMPPNTLIKILEVIEYPHNAQSIGNVLWMMTWLYLSQIGPKVNQLPPTHQLGKNHLGYRWMKTKWTLIGFWVNLRKQIWVQFCFPLFPPTFFFSFHFNNFLLFLPSCYLLFYLLMTLLPTYWPLPTYLLTNLHSCIYQQCAFQPCHCFSTTTIVVINFWI
jgi:hypothetical protein